MPDTNNNGVSLGDMRAPLNLSVDQQLRTNEPKEQPKMIHMAQPGIKPKVDINALRNNRSNVGGGTRTAANLSSLPVRSEVPEGMNVKTKESLEAEIFEQGGMFDQYLNEKMGEYKEWAIDRTQKAEEQKVQEEIAKEDSDIDNEPAETTTKEEQTEEQKEYNTNIPEARQMKMVDIHRSSPKKKDEENMENITSGSVQEFANPEAVEDKVYVAPEVDEEDEEYDIPEDVRENNITEDIDPEEEEYEIDSALLEAKKNRKKVEVTITPTVKSEPIPESTPVSNQVEEDFLDEGEEIEEEYEETENLKVENQPKPTPKKKSITSRIDKITRSYMALPAEDDDEEVEVTDDTAENDESINILKNMIAQKIKPVSIKTDITGFTIAKKGTMSTEILAIDQAAFAKWPLPATGITVSMREISGANLENLRGYLDRGRPDHRSALKIIYDHIVSPKPESFEAWLKSIAYADYDNLFMLVYISAFADANFIPVDCTSESCGKPYLTDSIPIMDMVKFKNSETEQKFWDLYNEEPSNAKALYTTEVVPISNNFAIGLKEPSLYSVLIEPDYFNADFTEKYAQTVRYFPYIDNIYWIDAARKTLVPIKWKVYDNNIAKSVRSRIRRYDKIINGLTSDQHALILAYINAINDRIDWFNYRLPETTCPHCGQVVEADDNYTALNLVFLRNRLAVLATI